jgi:WD40 repeat protein
VSIQISPATSSKAIGRSLQYTATGTYSDASTPDVTTSVSWNSSDTATVTISASGLATAVAAGSSDITATLDGMTSNTASLTVTSTWTATGEMVNGRYEHTATLLPNGKVLVSGGFNPDDDGTLASSELYDSATGVWTATTGAMTDARYYHSATLLPDGKVLVSGGYSHRTLPPGSELYDPATGLWTATTGAMTGARYLHTATLLADGKVLVSGGGRIENNVFVVLASSELYDPATGLWTATTGAMTDERMYHTATLLPDGRVLVSGGAGNDTYVESSELYDPATGLWTATTGAMTSARYLHTATLLPEGQVLVSGGSGFIRADSELYDPGTGLWIATAHLINGRSLHTATLLPDGQVLVCGGAQGIASSELY